jgi:hypothetical protein
MKSGPDFREYRTHHVASLLAPAADGVEDLFRIECELRTACSDWCEELLQCVIKTTL